jgi:hypothetical protein
MLKVYDMPNSDDDSDEGEAEFPCARNSKKSTKVVNSDEGSDDEEPELPCAKRKAVVVLETNDAKTKKYFLELLKKMSKKKVEKAAKETQQKRKTKAKKRFWEISKKASVRHAPQVWAHHLNEVCPTPSDCFSLGKHSVDLLHFFEKFSNFELVTNIRVLNSGNNGVIHELTYAKNGYTAHAVLKKNIGDGDNLVYEYLVGHLFVNQVSLQFPCFLQTYGLFYPSQYGVDLDHVADLPNLELQKKVDYKKMCSEGNNALLLIQHVHRSDTLQKIMEGKFSNDPFLSYDLLYVLFVVYHALSSLRSEFTHYDFYPGNLMLTWVDRNQYFEYHYHLEGRDLVFKCSYIPKIIDYGRCFIQPFAKAMKRILTKTKECNEHEGVPSDTAWDDKRFYFFKDEPSNPLRPYAIDAERKNESHDLLLIHRLKHKATTGRGMFYGPFHQNSFRYGSATASATELFNIVQKITYGVGLPFAERIYGTVENLSGNTTDKIFNVAGAFDELLAAATRPNCLQENTDFYEGKTKLGELHIYADKRPMRYAPV